MITLLKFKNIFIPYAIYFILIAAASCKKADQLEIQHNFPFEVQVMPVPKSISKEEKIEIRINIQRKDKYSNTQYFIRYFQFDGHGSLQYYNEPPFIPNDTYLLPTEAFRLYYTSTSTVSQAFDVWIFDNFGNEKQINFKFNNKE